MPGQVLGGRVARDEMTRNSQTGSLSTSTGSRSLSRSRWMDTHSIAPVSIELLAGRLGAWAVRCHGAGVANVIGTQPQRLGTRSRRKAPRSLHQAGLLDGMR